VREGDDVAEGVPGGDGREEEAVNDGVETGDGWSSSEDSSEPEVESEGGGVSGGRRGRNWNLFCNRFVGAAGDCGLIGDWVISPACPPVDVSFTGMRGRNENLEAKAERAFKSAGESEFRTKGGWLGENVLLLDKVFFDPSLVVVGGGGFEGGDGSDNNGSKPTGTRFNS
jgi:hypothetical protein